HEIVSFPFVGKKRELPVLQQFEPPSRLIVVDGVGGPHRADASPGLDGIGGRIARRKRLLDGRIELVVVRARHVKGSSLSKPLSPAACRRGVLQGTTPAVHSVESLR